MSFVFSLMGILIIRQGFSIGGFHAFGPDPIDSLDYLDRAIRTSHMSFFETIKYYNSESGYNNQFSFDDYGMSLISKIAYCIGGGQNGYIVVLTILNSLSIMISASLMYKISNYVLSDYSLNRIGSLMLGFCTGFYMIGAYGLKENIFLVFVMLSLYSIMKYYNAQTKKSLAVMLLAVALTSLFRFAVCLQLVMSFVVAFMLKKSGFKPYIYILLIIAAIGVALSLEFVVQFVGGRSLDSLMTYAEYSGSSSASLLVKFVSDSLFTVTGQPPLFTGEFGFGQLAVFSYVLRATLTPGLLFGLYLSFKLHDYKMCFFSIYWLLGSFMLVAALRGSDFRYYCIYLPAVFLLSLYGYKNIRHMRFNRLIALSVYAIILLITVFWNL